jgi:hypothetical protein
MRNIITVAVQLLEEGERSPRNEKLLSMILHEDG